MPVVTFKMEGIAHTIRQLEGISEAVQKELRKTLQIQLESWVVDAKMLTPVDTGALQESGRVVKPRGKGGSSVFFQIIFGGVTRRGKFVDYAAEVHENHPSGSGYLEKVVAARTPQLEDILERNLNKALKEGAR